MTVTIVTASNAGMVMNMTSAVVVTTTIITHFQSPHNLVFITLCGVLKIGS
jgi:hypothetical protein